MKNQKYLTTLKSLFDPLSKEWEATSFEEKRKEIQTKFEKEEMKDFALSHYIQGFSIHTSNDKPIEDEEWDALDKPLVAYSNLLLAVGFYLNKYIDPDYNFPRKVSEVKKIAKDLESLKDERKKETKEIREAIIKNFKGDTREFFDLPESSGHRQKIPVNIQKLKKLNQAGIQPIKILHLHVFDYESMGNYRHVVLEAPLSAFAICWNGKEFLSE
ncbi:MAG TPA: hypothetical protein PLP33_02755 [Leptospiraceae bacterium]|nr:hypothetical protein [Leptospiraceae bacterium]HNI87528.1 hypothetical protein [Leptospiraceae bacterium]HNL75817.1 hypothetical protein [Leptospiraceae bacterium]HNM88524.1 hypothetical protein [Leptospiraceae bacterium]